MSAGLDVVAVALVVFAIFRHHRCCSRFYLMQAEGISFHFTAVTLVVDSHGLCVPLGSARLGGLRLLLILFFLAAVVVFLLFAACCPIFVVVVVVVVVVIVVTVPRRDLAISTGPDEERDGCVL